MSIDQTVREITIEAAKVRVNMVRAAALIALVITGVSAVTSLPWPITVVAAMSFITLNTVGREYAHDKLVQAYDA